MSSSKATLYVLAKLNQHCPGACVSQFRSHSLHFNRRSELTTSVWRWYRWRRRPKVAISVRRFELTQFDNGAYRHLPARCSEMTITSLRSKRGVDASEHDSTTAYHRYSINHCQEILRNRCNPPFLIRSVGQWNEEGFFESPPDTALVFDWVFGNRRGTSVRTPIAETDANHHTSGHSEVAHSHSLAPMNCATR